MFDAFLVTRWKVWNEVRRWLVWPWVRLLFATNGIPWGQDWRFYGAPILQRYRDSEMRFGSHFQLRSAVGSNPLAPSHPVVLCTWQRGAVLEIGDYFAMTGGTLCAAESIRIGDRVTVGANSIIVDTDFHPIDAELRRRQPADVVPAPVAIEDDVFIGMSCLVLKGVSIGRGSVIGAGSVVVRNIPARSLAAGNPARLVRTL
jgi:acetyltransferase-like isoleucine patch superfamily enzyme